MSLIAALAIVPLAYLVWQSFHTPHTASSSAVATLANYRAAIGNGQLGTLLGNSLVFAAGTALFAFATGATLAWLNERTNVPFKRLFFALSLVPLVVPGIVFAVAWMLLASPRIGLVNLVLQQLFASDAVFVDVYSMAGMVFVDGLHYSPMAFLMMSAAFRAMDPSLEEAAVMSGAGPLEVARRVTVKLAWPAALATLLIVFVRAIESFEVPALIGLPAGIPVFTSAIYEAVHRYPSRVGLACAYAVGLLTIAAAGLWLQSRVAARGDAYATVSGRGSRPRTIDLGRWRPVAALLFASYLALVVVLPFAVLLWSSLQRFYATPSLAGVGALTLDAYRAVLDYPALSRAVANSVLLAAAAATIVVLVTAVIAWTVVRTRIRGRAVLDAVATLPIAVPGIVLGLALMTFHLDVPSGLYGTLGILLVAYVTRFMPYGMRYNVAALVRVHRELEESAAMSGASWATTFRRIVLPLVRPGLVAGWIYVAIVSLRELSSSILLYAPGTEVLAVVIWETWENGQYPQLAALGVLFIVALLVVVGLAQLAGGRFDAR